MFDAALGVKKGTVRIIDYNEQWPAYFQEEQMRLSILLDVKPDMIVHFGSTSICNCTSKPIIDIAIPLGCLFDARKYVDILKGSDYGFNNIYYLSDRICFSKGNPQVFLLYLVCEESPTYINWISFKDALNNDQGLVKEYNILKTELASRYSNDRITYTEKKTDFVYNILNKSEIWIEKMNSLKLI